MDNQVETIVLKNAQYPTGALTIPTEEVRTLYDGFEGHTKRSLTRISRRQRTLRLVLDGPFHIREAQIFGGHGDRFVHVRPQRQRHHSYIAPSELLRPVFLLLKYSAMHQVQSQKGDS